MLTLTTLPSDFGKGGVGLGDDEPGLRKFLKEHADALVAHDAQLLTSALGMPSMVWASPEIDLMAAPAVYQIIPAGTKFRFISASVAWAITQKSGTITTSPTFKVGADATNDDFAAAQTSSGFTTQAVNTRVLLSSSVSPAAALDLEPSGLKIEVTIPAAGTSNPILKARMYASALLISK